MALGCCGICEGHRLVTRVPPSAGTVRHSWGRATLSWTLMECRHSGRVIISLPCTCMGVMKVAIEHGRLIQNPR
jgi:hypothetical protein